MNKEKFVLSLCFCLVLLSGCASKEWKYAKSPYAHYGAHYRDNDASGKRIMELVNASKKNPPKTYWVHWQIAKWGYENDQLGTTLYALKELATYYPKSKAPYEFDFITFNIGIVMYRIGLQDSARGRFEYILANSNNMVLKNRSTAILLSFDNDIEITDDFYIYDI